jgi:NADPH:quinone reductase-like Zn-dependent oxidoreductase
MPRTIAPTMSAVVYTRYGPPDVLDVVEVPRPQPRDGEVLVRVRASTVSAAMSAARRADPAFARLAFGLVRPKHRVLGDVAAGTLESGERVVLTTGTRLGAHAEYVVAPRSSIVPLPDEVSFEHAAAVAEGGLTALPFLRDHGRVRTGTRLLVIGAAGGVGSAAVQLGKHLGAHVTGLCGPPNVELVRGIGADDVIDRSTTDATAARSAYDVVFDAAGVASFGAYRHALAVGGVYMTTVPSLAVLAQMAWTRVLGKRRAVVAFTGLRPTAERVADLATLVGLVHAGAVRPVIDASFPLARAREAHALTDTGHKRGEVVLTMP